MSQTLPERIVAMDLILKARENAQRDKHLIASARPELSGLDPLLLSLYHADDTLINFIDHWGRAPALVALRRVEALALYNCATPPLKCDLQDLWVLRQLIDHVHKLKQARIKDSAVFNEQSYIRRSLSNCQTADQGLITFIAELGETEVINSLRNTESRAAYWQQETPSSADMTSLMFYRELIDLISIYQSALISYVAAFPCKATRAGHVAQSKGVVSY